MDVAVVILNWNGAEMLRRYLPDVVRTASAFGGEGSGDCAFVVVADNGSTDGSLEMLEREFPSVKTIPLERNWGFAGGYNLALKQVEADYYILLNDDVAVSDGWIGPLFEFMEENPETGACQPKVLSDKDRAYFEYAGACGGFIDRYGYPFCRGRILSGIEKDSGQYDEPVETFWASGACLMIRSALFHHLGGFDDRFFAHMEEIDLCWRAKLLGYQIWCVPQSSVYHLGGGTLPNNSPDKLYLNYRNNLMMLFKNLPESIRAGRIRQRMLIDAASAAVYLLTGRFAFFKSVCRAHRDFLAVRGSLDPSPFEAEMNNAGYLDGSIIWKFFVSGRKLTFGSLDM